MANIGVTEAADFIPEIWAADALGALKANTVWARLVNRNWDQRFFSQGDILHIPKRGTLTVNTKGEDAEYTLQTPSSSKVDVTLDRHKEVSFIVEDPVAAQANQDVMAGYTADAGIVLAEEVDAYLATFAATFSGNVGAFGTDIDADTVVDAMKSLVDNKAPFMDTANMHLILKPKDAAALKKIEKLTNSETLGNGETPIVSGFLGQRYGFNLYENQSVVQDGLGPDVHNLAFHRDAIVLAMRPLPNIGAQFGTVSTVMAEDNLGLRVLNSYSHKDGGMLVTVDLLYGASELRDEFGIEVRG